MQEMNFVLMSCPHTTVYPRLRWRSRCRVAAFAAVAVVEPLSLLSALLSLSLLPLSLLSLSLLSLLSLSPLSRSPLSPPWRSVLSLVRCALFARGLSGSWCRCRLGSEHGEARSAVDTEDTARRGTP